jgi:anti-sigma-K factor RskA
VNDIHSLAGEYAVGSLTEEETQEFEAHLATCQDCRKEVADMRDIAVQLSEAVATEPPSSLREFVLERISHTAQQDPPGQHRPAGAGGNASSRRDVTGTSGGGNVIPMQRAAQRGNRVVGLLAAAAVVAAIAMGGWAIHSRNDANQATTQAQQLTQLLAAKDVKTVSGSFSKGGGATVVVSASQHRALLVAHGLPALPDGKVYEAWTITGSPAPAGTFTPGSAQTVLSLPAAAVTAQQVAVTVEPAGGSTKPSTNPLFAVKIPRA